MSKISKKNNVRAIFDSAIETKGSLWGDGRISLIFVAPSLRGQGKMKGRLARTFNFLANTDNTSSIINKLSPILTGEENRADQRESLNTFIDHLRKAEGKEFLLDVEYVEAKDLFNINEIKAVA